MNSIEGRKARPFKRPSAPRRAAAGSAPEDRSALRWINRQSSPFAALTALAAAVALLCSAPAPCKAQTIYVASQFSSTVGEYNATTGAAINTSFVTGLFKPQNLARSGNDLYVTNLINS